MTAASNAVGTVPDLPGIVAAAHAAGARVYVDAVHAAPHRPLDVEALGVRRARLLGLQVVRPHIGILWAPPELLAELGPDKLPALARRGPGPLGLGTLPFESLAGVRAAADYMLSTDWDGPRARGRAAANRADGARRDART